MKENKEDYIFEIAHDLKSPVMSINLALENIERNEFLDEIYKINKHNLNYIENIIENYMFKKGKYCSKFETINILNVIKEEFYVLRYLIAEKNLKISYQNKNLNECCIISDRFLVRQIILNILTNAVKYTKNNGEISVLFDTKNNYLSVCFLNPYSKENCKFCSSKMGQQIIKAKLKAIGGKFKITKKKDEYCFNLLLKRR